MSLCVCVSAADFRQNSLTTRFRNCILQKSIICIICVMRVWFTFMCSCDYVLCRPYPMHCTDAAYCYRLRTECGLYVCLRVCFSHRCILCKTAEPIEMKFGADLRGPKAPSITWSRSSTRRGNFEDYPANWKGSLLRCMQQKGSFSVQ